MFMQPLKTLLSLTICTLVFFVNGFSQTPIRKYEKEWKQVQSYAKKNLPKSAFTEVKKDL